MVGELVPSDPAGRPQRVPSILRSHLNHAYSELNCVAPTALSSGLATDRINYRVCGYPALTRDKAVVAGSVPAVKDALLHYNGSRIRGRRSVEGPSQASPDPELIQID